MVAERSMSIQIQEVESVTVNKELLRGFDAQFGVAR